MTIVVRSIPRKKLNMLLHINKFLDRIKAMESRPQRELTMTLAEARDLHTDITRILILLQDLHEQRQATPADSASIEVDGGRF